MREIMLEETRPGFWKPESNASRLKRFLMPWRAYSRPKGEEELDPADEWVRLQLWIAVISVFLSALVFYVVRHQ